MSYQTMPAATKPSASSYPETLVYECSDKVSSLPRMQERPGSPLHHKQQRALEALSLQRAQLPNNT